MGRRSIHNMYEEGIIMKATLSVITIIIVMAASEIALAEGLEPWASNRQPGDNAKQHVQEVSTSRGEYSIKQGGTMDGQNCRSPQDMWQSYEQTWESNR